MCPSADPLAVNATCGGGSGWIVFEDPDGNCDRADTEELITGARIDDDVQAATNSGCISFASTGFKRASPASLRRPTSFIAMTAATRRKIPAAPTQPRAASRSRRPAVAP